MARITITWTINPLLRIARCPGKYKGTVESAIEQAGEFGIWLHIKGTQSLRSHSYPNMIAQRDIKEFCVTYGHICHIELTRPIRFVEA